MKNILLIPLFLSYSFIFSAQIMIGSDQNSLSNSVFQVKGDSSSSDSTDLLLVTDEGNVGIGVSNPNSRLEIKGSDDKNVPILRIEDGKWEVGQVAASDAQGYLKWIDMPNLETAHYSLIFNAVSTFNLNENNLLIAMPVTVDGLYQVILRWWGVSSSANAQNTTAALFSLASSTDSSQNWSADKLLVQDQTEQYILSTNTNYFCFTSMLSISVTDVPSYLKLYIKVTIGGPWKIGTPNSTGPLWNPSIVVFKI